MSSFDGDRLRAARKRRRLSRQQLGSAVGVDGREIGRWEQGKRTPGQADVLALADVLLLPPGQLLRRKHQQMDPGEPAGPAVRRSWLGRVDRRGRR